MAANHPPVFGQIPNATIVAGYTLHVPAGSYAVDTDSPPQALTFSLLTAPANAALDPAFGNFTWRPRLSQAPIITAVLLAATDNGHPPLSATQRFWVTVNSPAQPSVGACGLSNGLFTFTIYGDAGPDYSILRSTNLLDWEPVWTNYSGTLPFESADPATAKLSRGCYRVVLGP